MKSRIFSFEDSGFFWLFLMMKNRNRLTYFFLILITIIFGIFSRSSYIPKFIYPYLGDFLYTLMLFFIFGFLFPKKKVFQIAMMSIGLCFLIEISQLYQADWINAIRKTIIGKWTLGSGFLWSDIVSYTLGGLFGVFIEKVFH